MSDVGERELLAIIFTDAVDSTARTASDEDYSLRILLADLDYMRNEAAVRGGTVLKNTGDGLLISFKSAVDAMECALSIQRGFADRVETAAFRHKIGVHIGDVIKKEGDIYGSGVNTASRLVAQCPAGGLCISSTLFELVKQKSEIGNLKTNAFQLKNIEPPIKAYAVTDFQKTELPSNHHHKIPSTRKTKNRVVPYLASTILLAVGLAIFFGIAKSRHPKTASHENRGALLQNPEIQNNNSFQENDEIIGDWEYQGGASLSINPDGTVLQGWEGGGAAGRIFQTNARKYTIRYESEKNKWSENIELHPDGLSFKGLNNFGEFVFAKRQNPKNEKVPEKQPFNLAGIWTGKGDSRNEESGGSRYYVNQEQNIVVLFSEEKPTNPRYAHVIVGEIKKENIEGTLFDLPKGSSMTVCKVQGHILNENEIKLRVVGSKFEWSIVRIQEPNRASPINPQ